MKFPRRSGVLLHPTSLPGPFGLGDMGPEAYRFVDWLERAGQRLWQILPLGPTGYGDSPYQSFSAFAGNPMLISPQRLVEEGWLDSAALSDVPNFSADRVEYSRAIEWKQALLRAAFERFQTGDQRAIQHWAADNASWLPDYALFIALKEHFGGGPWKDWPQPLRARDEKTLERYRAELADEIQFQTFLQFLFHQQWVTLRAYAHGRGIAIVGDIPIFIAHDSADAWANRSMFYINEDGSLQVQAGVPPDYFSETGQLWGNPLYRWERMAEDGYAWWIARFRALLNLVDIVRLDHFRGFAAYWAVPGDAPTAVKGEWLPGPNAPFFRAIHSAMGELPIIAEDLGLITPDVVAIREEFDYPGMRILQFAFTGDVTSDFLPHNYVQNTVAYTGTHDNDTTLGWYESLNDQEKAWVLAYLDTSEAQVVRAMVRAVISSVADTAVVPMQDLLEQGTESRMNMPGITGGNWQWRATADAFSDERAAWLAQLSDLYGRR